jgi:hypothetical protein
MSVMKPCAAYNRVLLSSVKLLSNVGLDLEAEVGYKLIANRLRSNLECHLPRIFLGQSGSANRLSIGKINALFHQKGKQY